MDALDISVLESTRSAKTDRRSRKTKSALAKALMDIMQKKPIGEITIKELTDEADVNRSTFYIHYQDIYDMLAHIKRDICDTCIGMLAAHKDEIARNDFRALFKDILVYMDTDECFYLVFQQERMSNGIPGVSGEISESLKASCMDAIRPLEKLSDRTRRALKARGISAENLACMHIDYLFDGIFGMIDRWFATGKRESISFMASLLTSYFESVDFEKRVAAALAD